LDFIDLWCRVGNFNVVRKAEERKEIGQRHISLIEMKDFNDFFRKVRSCRGTYG